MRPSVLVTRATFPDIADRLREHFDAEDNRLWLRVHGATLGILGMGRIGQAIARRGAFGFGMRIIYHNRSRLPAGVEAECRPQYVDKAMLLRETDHLVPNVVLTPHIGSASVDTLRAMHALTVDNLIAALGWVPRAGHPPTPVNTPTMG